MDKLIEISRLSRTFLDGSGNKLSVLQDLDFTIEQQQSVAIVGSSGTGKSVFLNILGAMDTPSSGSVLFLGKDIHKFSLDQAAEWRNRSLGFVFQFYPLMNDFSCIENVLLPAMIRGVSYKEAHQKASEKLAAVGLSSRAHFLVRHLSGGEQQRAAIARALINQPKLILADEPTGNLDPETGRRVIEVLKQETKALKAALVIVTHNHSLAKEMDRVLELADGKLHPK